MKNAKRKPLFYRSNYDNIKPIINDEYEVQHQFDNKKDIIIGKNDILIKINAINDSNFENFFETLEKQNKIWHICKIKGESYLKIDLL
jgi:hypothetical protein